MKPRRIFKRKTHAAHHAGGPFFNRSPSSEQTFFQGAIEGGAIHRSEALPSKGMQLRSPELRGHAVFATVLAGQTLLRRGYWDSAAVQTLQSVLKRVGHDPGPVDGIWGPMTSGALIAFQDARGLTRDGILGPRTLTALDREITAYPTEMPPYEPPDPALLKPLIERIGAADTPDAKTFAAIDTLLTLIGVPGEQGGQVMRLGGKAGARDQTDGLGLLISALSRIRKSVPGPQGEQVPATLGETHKGINTSDSGSRTWWYWQNSMFGFIALFRGWRTELQAGRKTNEKALAAAVFAVQHVGTVDATATGKDGMRRDWPLLHRIFSVSCTISTPGNPGFYDANRKAAVRTAGAKLDSWCGIFTNYACLSTGATTGKWPAPGFVKWKSHNFKQVNIPDPKPGDVINAPLNKSNHFALCLEYDPSSHQITTIDGNSAPGGGASGGKIVVQKRHRSWWRGFWQAPL